MMASKKVQYLPCAASLVTAAYGKYASFLGICDGLILNFFRSDLKSTFYELLNNDAKDNNSINMVC